MNQKQTQKALRDMFGPMNATPAPSTSAAETAREIIDTVNLYHGCRIEADVSDDIAAIIQALLDASKAPAPVRTDKFNHALSVLESMASRFDMIETVKCMAVINAQLEAS